MTSGKATVDDIVVKNGHIQKSDPRSLTKGLVKPVPGATPSQRAAKLMGARIRKARQQLGISLSVLAGKDFSRAFLNQIELGTARPSVRNLQIIAKRLNRPLEYFLQDDELSATAIELALTEAETSLRRGDGPQARRLIANLLERQNLPEEIRVRIDLIHAHLAYAATWAALASRITGVPSVATLHVAPPSRGAGRLRDRLMRFALRLSISRPIRRTLCCTSVLPSYPWPPASTSSAICWSTGICIWRRK